MVEEKVREGVLEADEVPEPRDRYYHPGRVAEFLYSWDKVRSDAEGVAALRLRLTPPSTKHLFADLMQWATIEADILSAWGSLDPTGKGFKLIYLVMQGNSVEAAGGLLRPRLDPKASSQVFWNAVRDMARFLGWRPPC